MSFDPIALAMMKKQLPCYDTRKSDPLTIEWDGEIGGRETTSFMFEPFVKLSEATPTYEEIVQATIRFSIGDGAEFAFMDAREEGMPCAAYCNAEGMPLCLFIFDNFEMEGMAFSKGIYSFCKETDLGKIYVEYLHLPSVTTGELKTIDPKFLPSVGGTQKFYFDMGSLMGESENHFLYTEDDVNDDSKRATASQVLDVLRNGKTIVLVAQGTNDSAFVFPNVVFMVGESVEEGVTLAVRLFMGEQTIEGYLYTAEYNT